MARATRRAPTTMRKRREAGAWGTGTGGSRVPMPVSLCGGPPPRAEEDCGSGSEAFSLNSWGMKMEFTPMGGGRPYEREEEEERRRAVGLGRPTLHFDRYVLEGMSDGILGDDLIAAVFGDVVVKELRWAGI